MEVVMDDDAFEKIEAFINGDMSAEEKNQFEKELAADETLQQRLQLYRQIQNTLAASAANKQNENALQQTLSGVYKEYAAPKKVISFSARKWYAVAAAVAIAAVAVYLLLPAKKADAEKLFAQYAVFPSLSYTRGANDSMTAKAVAYYNNQRFAEALPLLQQLYAADTSNTEIQLAFLICEMQTRNNAAALAGFTKIASTENVFTYQAKWYMALAYLKQKNIAACEATLQGIPADADTYKKAQQLLDELE